MSDEIFNNVQVLIEEIRKNNPELKSFSKDVQQINPEARVISITEIITEILRNIHLPKKSKILEIGTGYGYGAVILNSIGYNVIGIDSNKEKIEEGMKYWKKLGVEFKQINEFSSFFETNEKLYFMHRDSRNINDIPNSSIDMVVSFYISRYMLGKNGAYRDTGRILKKDSMLVMTTEGIFKGKILEKIQKPIIRIISRFFEPENMRYEKIITIDNNNVYDKYIIIMRKKDREI